MGNIIRKFSLIMFVNLFAFLAIWHTLDVFLGTKAQYKIIFLVLSVVSLIFLSKKFFNKTMKDMEEISPEENNKNNKQNKNEWT